VASRYEIHFGVSTFGSQQQLRSVSTASLSDQLRGTLGASEEASDDRMLALVASLRSTLEAVAAGTATAQDAATALAALTTP
jgi:hypothetical protein